MNSWSMLNNPTFKTNNTSFFSNSSYPETKGSIWDVVINPFSALPTNMQQRFTPNISEPLEKNPLSDVSSYLPQQQSHESSNLHYKTTKTSEETDLDFDIFGIKESTFLKTLPTSKTKQTAKESLKRRTTSLPSDTRVKRSKQRLNENIYLGIEDGIINGAKPVRNCVINKGRPAGNGQKNQQNDDLQKTTINKKVNKNCTAVSANKTQQSMNCRKKAQEIENICSEISRKNTYEEKEKKKSSTKKRQNNDKNECVSPKFVQEVTESNTHGSNQGLLPSVSSINETSRKAINIQHKKDEILQKNTPRQCSDIVKPRIVKKSGFQISVPFEKMVFHKLQPGVLSTCAVTANDISCGYIHINSHKCLTSATKSRTIFTVLSGRLNVIQNDKSYVVMEGTVINIPSGVPYSFKNDTAEEVQLSYFKCN